MKCETQFWNTGGTLGEQHSCYQTQIGRLSKALSHLRIGSFDGSVAPSKIVRNALEHEFRTRDWDLSMLLAPRFPRDIPNQTVLIDASSSAREKDCQERHLLSVEICFDNRQTIGTNLLKMEMARREFLKQGKGETLGLLIVASRQTLRDGGWDNSVGSSEEYETALISGYGSLIRCPVGLHVLRFETRRT